MNDTQNVVAWRMRKNDETGWILTESKPMPLNHEEAAWEVQPLYASPQASPPPQPSAQGEPVALTEPACHGNGGCCPDDKCEKWKPRASAPSTPPPAVVEAVPQAWPIERAADMLTAYAELVKATGRYAEEHYIPEIENVAAELRGIAPKAAQEPRDA